MVWTNAVDSAIQGTEIQFKKNGEADSLYVTATLAGRARTTAEIANVTVGVTYNIRVRHFSFDNVSSVYSSVANIAIAQPDTITNPSNLGVTTDKPFNIELSWTNPSNTNMRAVDVHADTTTGYAPSTSNLIGTYYGDIGKKKTVLIGRSHGLSYDQDYYFKIRAVNIYGSVVEDGSGNPVYVTSPAGKIKKVTTVDVENLSATVVNTGTLNASLVSVTNLNATNINTGKLTLSGSATDAVRLGKGTFEDTSVSGFFLGFTAAPATIEPAFSIGNATSGLSYKPSTGLSIKGSVEATSGKIADFLINTTSITDVANSFGLSSAVTGGDDVRFYAGATLANKATAPFRVTEAGAVTATSGTIGGFTIGSTSLIAGANTTRVSLSTADGIHLGNNTFSSAPFRVTKAGVVTATSATITGAITATSGAVSYTHLTLPKNREV